MTMNRSRKQPRGTGRARPRKTQPPEMKTTDYIYGVEKVDGNDAWAMFEACEAGDFSTVKELVRKDRRLINAQFWYQFPIHMAVREGHEQIVKLLLDAGADPGQSRFTYNSWDKLLLRARERGYRQIEALLQRAMVKKFQYSPQFEMLKEAIVARSARRINAVLRKQPQLIRKSDALGNSALHWSVMTRQLGLIKQFVDLGAPIDAERADGCTPVLLAVHGSDYWYRETRGSSHPSLRNAWVMVGSLLAQGARYTISVAAATGDQERVEQLLRKDADLARRLDSARRSPLAHAAREGHKHIVQLLLEHGADPNIPQDGAPDGLALYEACCRNRLDVAELLLKHGANPNAGVDSCECCLTICAIYHGEQARPLQELLRRHGAFTPPYRMDVEQLKQAIRDGHEVVRHEEFLGNVMAKADRQLLELYLDSDPTVVDRMQLGGSGDYPRSAALVRMLLERGLDPNRPDWSGKTMLHACAANGDRDVAAVLLDAGADINAREREFKGTPLAVAVYSCVPGQDQQVESARRMVEFLLERGAATNLPDDELWATPLAWARERGLVEIEELLQRHGTSETDGPAE
jgi:ankyrin repeat protein